MYAYLQGKFTFKSPALIHVDVNGIGFEVNVSLNTFSAVQHLSEGKLFTYLQVKEDSHTLFGFHERQEKEVFLHLISVSGVGASTARMMLSSIRPDEITNAVVQGNVRLLESVKGIGKKTAERLVLELKDKLGKGLPAGFADVAVASIDSDALNALVALGIQKNQAEQAVAKIKKAEPAINNLEELIKKSLKAI